MYKKDAIMNGRYHCKKTSNELYLNQYVTTITMGEKDRGVRGGKCTVFDGGMIKSQNNC